jgi:hypothetical protein
MVALLGLLELGGGEEVHLGAKGYDRRHYA